MARERSESSPHTSWAAMLASGLLALNGVALVCTLLESRSHPLIGRVAAVLIALPLYALLGYRFRSVVAAFAPLVGCALAFGAATSGADLLAVVFGERAMGLPVMEAPEHPSAAIYGFTDGETKRHLSGSHRVPSDDGEVEYRVVPIVPAGWTPSQSVTAWAACETSADIRCSGDWGLPHRAGVAVAPSERDSYVKAVSSAAEKHKLVSVPGAPILRWAATPSEIGRARGDWAVTLFALANAGWVLALIGSRLLRLRSARNEE